MYRLIKRNANGSVELIQDNLDLSTARYLKVEKSGHGQRGYEVEEKCSCSDSVCCPEDIKSIHCAYCNKPI